jgi:hypothetical protein
MECVHFDDYGRATLPLPTRQDIPADHLGLDHDRDDRDRERLLLTVEHNGRRQTLRIVGDSLPHLVSELAVDATELALQIAEEAAVEAVADSLRAHLSDAVAGDETAPHEATDIEGADLALPIAAGGCVMETTDDDRPQQDDDALRDEARREGWVEVRGRQTRGAEEQ